VAPDSLLELFHAIADAVDDALGAVTDWGPSGRRDTQYAADLVADAIVLDHLRAAGLGVLSEESGAENLDRPIVVVVDPLDGSTNASRGLPWYATSICIVDRDGLRAALVAEQSGSETRYAAVRGGGANCDGVPLRVRPVTSLGDAVIGVNGAPPHDPGWWQTRSLGAAALDISLVAKGALDGYVDFHDHGVWDYLAAVLICREAGCVVDDAEGRDLLVLDPAVRRSPVVANSRPLLDALTSARRRSLR